MKALKTTLLATLFAAATASAAYAHAPADGPKGDRAQKMHEHFKNSDKNADGKISREEANASMPRIAKHFDAIDTDKDGQVTKDELRAFHERKRASKEPK